MANIQQHRINAILDKQMRFDGVIMTRRQWLKKQLSEGATVHEEMRSKTTYNRTRFNRMNWEEQKAYEERMNTKVPCYELKTKDGGYYDITKTEYDHFQELQLAEDIKTEQYSTANRIEAGIATEQEVQEYMDKDFEFFSKYCPNG